MAENDYNANIYWCSLHSPTGPYGLHGVRAHSVDSLPTPSPLRPHSVTTPCLTMEWVWSGYGVGKESVEWVRSGHGVYYKK